MGAPPGGPSRDRHGPSVGMLLRAFPRAGLAAGERMPHVSDEVLRARRPLYYIAVALVILALALQQPLIFVAGLLVTAMAALPEIWYRYGLRDLSIEHTLSASRAVFGDTVEVSLTIENRKVLPLSWLQIGDELPDALPVLGLQLGASPKPEAAVLRNTLALWAYQRVRRRYRVRAVERGAYTFGPVDLRLGDPFGILTRQAQHTAAATLLVYPLIAPIERFGLSPRAPFGERAAPRRLLEDPMRVAGTRAYAPGDEPRRIHWKATARTGSLHSKVYEPSAKHTLAIFLDVRTFAHVRMGYVPELVELAISATASVARWGIEQGYAVGLISNGTLGALGRDAAPQTRPATSDKTTDQSPAARIPVAFRLRVAPSPRPEQLSLLLDGLARLLPYYGAPLHQLLAAEHNTLPPGSTIIYIGSETLVDVPTLAALRQLQARGHTVSLLLTTPDHPLSAGEVERHELHLTGVRIHHLGGEAAWRALVADVLGPGPLRRASSPMDTLRTPAERRTILEGIHLPARGARDRENTTQDTSEETRGANGDTDGRAGSDDRSLGPRPMAIE